MHIAHESEKMVTHLLATLQGWAGQTIQILMDTLDREGNIMQNLLQGELLQVEIRSREGMVSLALCVDEPTRTTFVGTSTDAIREILVDENSVKIEKKTGLKMHIKHLVEQQ